MAEEPKQHAAAAEIVAADLESDQDDILQRRRPRQARSGGGVSWWLVAALLIGVAVGAWLAGAYWGPQETPQVLPSDHPATETQGPGHMPGMNADDETNLARLMELEQLVKDQPDNVDALLEMGTLAYKLGDADMARNSWLEVTRINPQQIEAWSNLGFIYLAVDPPDLEAARAALETALELDPESEMADGIRYQLDLLDQPTGG